MINVPEQIRQICLKDNSNKNFRVHFVNGELPDLVNDNIVSESVSLTESLCSGGFRFGACEASVLEFDCDLKAKVKNVEIEAWLEVDVSNESESFIAEHGKTSDDVPFPFFPIYYGKFTIDSCKRNNNGLMHVVAYTQLLGDEKKVGDRTIQFGEWGLSELELAKMQLETGNADYIMPLVTFVYANLDGMTDLSELPNEPYEALQTSTTHTRLTLIVDGEKKAPSELPFVINVYAEQRDNNNALLSNNQKSCFCYFGVDNQLELVNDIVRKYYGKTAYAYSNLRLAEKMYVSLDNGGSELLIEGCPVNGIFNPYVSATSTEMSKFKWRLLFRNLSRVTVEDENGTIIDEYIYDGERSYIKHIIFDEYSYFPVATFPRTVTTKIGKTTKYSLDYLALLNDGFVVSQKDKKGNAQTNTYQFNFRELVESYFETGRSFVRDWRSTDGYSIKYLKWTSFFEFPSETLLPSDDVDPYGHAFHIPSSVIVSAEWDDEEIKPFGKVVCTCSPSDSTTELSYEKEIIDTSEMQDDDYLVYDLSSNYLISISNPKKADIESLIDVISYGLEELKFTNSSIETLGLPFVEVGDYVSYETHDGSFTALVTRQTLKGVKNVRTTIESEV